MRTSCSKMLCGLLLVLCANTVYGVRLKVTDVKVPTYYKDGELTFSGPHVKLTAWNNGEKIIKNMWAQERNISYANGTLTNGTTEWKFNTTWLHKLLENLKVVNAWKSTPAPAKVKCSQVAKKPTTERRLPPPTAEHLKKQAKQREREDENKRKQKAEAKLNAAKKQAKKELAAQWEEAKAAYQNSCQWAQETKCERCSDPDPGFFREVGRVGSWLFASNCHDCEKVQRYNRGDADAKYKERCDDLKERERKRVLKLLADQ